MSTIYTRAHDTIFVDEVCRNTGMAEADINEYYQVIHKNQFQVVEDGRYKEYLNKYEKPGYNAAVDMLYTELTLHDYLNFLSNSYTPEQIKNKNNLEEYPIQLFENDNIYFNHQTEDRIIKNNNPSYRI